MRIALVSSNVNAYEGVPRYVAVLARVLAHDHEVTIFSATLEGVDDPHIRHRKVWTVGRGLIFDVSFTLSCLVILLLARLSDRVKGSKRFDVVHGHHYSSPLLCDVITSHYCEQEGRARMQRQEDGTARVGLLGRLRSWFMASFEGSLVARPNGPPVIVLSEGMKSDFLKHDPASADKMSVVYSGVDCETFSPDNVLRYREDVRRRHSLAPDELVILFVGGDWERKGVAQAIEGLSLVGSLQSKLLVVGPGNISAY